MYWELYDKAKAIIKEDTYMEFYNEREPLYLEIDKSGVGLGAGLPQVTDGVNCLKDKTPDKTIYDP